MNANRVQNFQVMNTRKDGRVTPESKSPEAKIGQLSITATGGHPGRSVEFASIRRWTAPAPGKVRIEGTLGHANANGDGVRGRIVASSGGKLGEWTVHNQKAETKLDAIQVEAGETIDFVVAPLTNATADGYPWAPTVSFTGQGMAEALKTWNAKKDFDAAPKVITPLSRWEELAQVLLLSNELAFVD